MAGFTRASVAGGVARASCAEDGQVPIQCCGNGHVGIGCQDLVISADSTDIWNEYEWDVHTSSVGNHSYHINTLMISLSDEY